jgi:hypothetical protein
MSHVGSTLRDHNMLPSECQTPASGRSRGVEATAGLVWHSGDFANMRTEPRTHRRSRTLVPAILVVRTLAVLWVAANRHNAGGWRQCTAAQKRSCFLEGDARRYEKPAQMKLADAYQR